MLVVCLFSASDSWLPLDLESLVLLVPMMGTFTVYEKSDSADDLAHLTSIRLRVLLACCSFFAFKCH